MIETKTINVTICDICGEEAKQFSMRIDGTDLCSEKCRITHTYNIREQSADVGFEEIGSANWYLDKRLATRRWWAFTNRDTQ